MRETLPKKIVKTVEILDKHHAKIAAGAENLSMTSGIVAGIAAAGAAIAAPSGLTAFGVWLGITSAPLIVTAAPVLATIATITGTLSGGAYFYSLLKRRRQQNDEHESTVAGHSLSESNIETKSTKKIHIPKLIKNK